MFVKMGEVAGGTTGAMFDGRITELPGLKFDGYTKQGFIQQCALSILAYSDFDRHDLRKLVNRALSAATLLANELKLK